MRRDGQHRDAVAVAVVEAVDQVQVARATGTRTDSERAGEVGLAPGCEGRRLLVTNMHPLDLAVAAKRIGQPVQAIADDAVNPLDAGGFKSFSELICDGLHNLAPLLVHVYMDTAFSNLARGDDCSLLTQAASYFVDIHTLVLSVIRSGDACSLAGRERSPHDTQAGAGPSIAVSGAARSEQILRIDTQKARKRDIVGSIAWRRFEAAFESNAVVPFHAPRAERNRIGRTAAGQHVVPFQLTDAIDMAAFPRPKLGAGAGEVCALPARQPAQYLQVLPRLFPAGCLCSGQTFDVARIVVDGRQIGDDVPGNRQTRNDALVLRQPPAIAAIVVGLGCVNRRVHTFRRNIRIGGDTSESRSERAEINRTAVAVPRRGA